MQSKKLFLSSMIPRFFVSIRGFMLSQKGKRFERRQKRKSRANSAMILPGRGNRSPRYDNFSYCTGLSVSLSNQNAST